MRDILVVGIWLGVVLAGFPLMERLDRFIDRRVKEPQEEDDDAPQERRG